MSRNSAISTCVLAISSLYFFFLTQSIYADLALYASTQFTNGSTPPSLYTIDLVGGGPATPVGPHGAGIAALSYNNTNQTMYGSSGSQLYTVDLSNGAATLIGGSLGSTQAIAHDGLSLFGMELSGNGDLFKIDTTTGNVSSVVGNTGFDRVRGLAYDPANDLLYGVYIPPGFNALAELIEIDPNTASASSIGSIGFSGMANIAYDTENGILYGLRDAPGNDELLQINTSTGAGTIINANLGGNLRGLAIVAVPEASTILIWSVLTVGVLNRRVAK